MYHKGAIIVYVLNKLGSKYIKQELMENKNKFTNQYGTIEYNIPFSELRDWTKNCIDRDYLENMIYKSIKEI